MSCATSLRGFLAGRCHSGIAIILAICGFAAADAIAQTFPLSAPAPVLDMGGGVVSLAPTIDGGYLVGGTFRAASGIPRTGLAKLKGNGDIDIAFGVTLNGTVSFVGIAGANAFVAGSFTQVGPSSKPYLAKMSASTGAGDSAFSPAPNVAPVAVALDGNGFVYAAGSFTSIGGVAGRTLVKLDPNTGAAVSAWNPVFPKTFDMQSMTLAVNGNWLYVSGSVPVFDTVNCYTGQLARVDLATGTVDSSWNPPAASVNRGGLDMAFDASGNVFVAGGGFIFNAAGCSGAGQGTAPGLVKLNVANGALASGFAPSGVGDASGIVADASAVYAIVAAASAMDGDRGLGGAYQRKVVKLDASTGSQLWSSAPDAALFGRLFAGSSALLASGNGLRSLGGPATFGLAALDRTTGAQVGSFAARLTIQGGGLAVAVSPADGRLYLGGMFDFVNGVARSNLVRLNADGSVDPSWDGGVNGQVWTLHIFGSSLYAGGYFDKSGSATRQGAARFDVASGSLDPAWNPAIGGAARYVLATDTGVYLAGAFRTVGGAAKPALAKVDATTGAVMTAFSPPIGDDCGGVFFINVTSVALAGARLHVAAQRGTLRNTPCLTDLVQTRNTRRSLLRLDPNTGAEDTSWDPNPNGNMRAFVVSGNDLFVAGGFSNIAGASRPQFAKFNLATGALDPGWIPSSALSTEPITLARSSTHLYAGSFANELRRFSLTDGTRDATWSPSVTNQAFGYSNGRNAAVSPDGSGVIFSLGHAYSRAANGAPAEGMAVFATGTVAQKTGPFAYVANSGSNSVSVIDTARNTVTATVPVGTNPTHTAVNPSATRVYVAARTANSVDVIDAATNTVVASIPVPNGPQSPNVTLDGSKVYVSNNASNTVTVISTATNTVARTITVGPNPLGIGRTATRVYVANNGGNTVSVIDAATDTVINTITVGSNPSSVLINGSGTRLYVTNVGSNTISVVDAATSAIVTTIPVGTAPRGLRFSLDGRKIYVANSGSDNSVSVVDPATFTVVRTIPVGVSPRTVTLTPDGAFLYVANNGSNSVSVLSTVTDTVIGTIAVGTSPIGISLAPTVPAAPTIGSITVGNGQATVSFTAPAITGFSTITSYTVSCSTPPGFSPSTTFTASGASSPLTVTGLTNGVTYLCTLTATNAVGVGTPSAAVTVVAAAPAAPTAMIATNTAHTLAVDVSGKLYAWGNNASGQLGDGSTRARSAPIAVAIAASVKAVAVGEGFSAALDGAGNVWGWGDNRALPFGPSVALSSTPQLIKGVSSVTAIAAGASGLVLYLLSDGTVKMSGTLPGFTTGADPTTVAGLSGIVAVAAGSSAYALRNDGAVFAWGGNAFGELGNGSTTGSAVPVQVSGIPGSVTRIAAANYRGGAVTSDGKVWTWGKELSGNGPSGSTSAVQVSGITDAADLSLAYAASYVRRQAGGLYAWGTTGHGNASGNFTPAAIPFFEPVQSIVGGAGHTLAFIIGKTGLVWGFGFYGNVSGNSASLGDGAFVARTTPVVVLAAGGKGSLDTNDWYLDLDPSTPETIPAGSTPKSLGVAAVVGANAALDVDAQVKYKASDFGKAVNNYVFGLVPARFFGFVKAAPGTPPMETLEKLAKDNEGYLLAQLTPQGWMVVQNQLTSFSQSTANAAGSAVNLLEGIPASQFAGSRFCIGYGEGSGSMLSFQSLSEVLQLEGATPKSTNVPCVLTGVYVDGPAKSRSGSAATFNASVVGLLPSGSVQFTDGGSSLQSAVAITRQNEAVAKASLTTSALSVGLHTIGVTYLGDAQNAAAAAAIPVRHEVEAIPPGESKTVIEGATSSNLGSTAIFTATVTGNNPSGSVQFKDNGVPFGDAVPLPRDGGGRVVLRTAELPAGTHGISATYSGDSANQASTSTVIPHAVLPGVTTSVAVAASAESLSTGSPVTLTASVTGASPTGTVTFRDGTQVLGTATLANGSASITIASLQAGGYAITADYAGDGQNPAVTSARAVFVSVNVPGSVTLLTASVGFGGHSIRTTATKPVDVLNTSGAVLSVSSVSISGAAEFTASQDCAAVANGSSCRVLVRFTPTSEAAYAGVLTIQSNKGTFTVPLSGSGEKTLVAHYYRSILGRDPDDGGKAYWQSEAARMQSLGVNVNETWYALAMAFYLSPEYASYGRNPTDYVKDLYNTFFNRTADAGGLSYWTGLIASGLPQEIVLTSFMFSGEFVNFTQAIFGNTAARAEVDTVVDFYRGLLSRLPDSAGFQYWVGQFRAAQCQGAAAVYAQVESISSAYANSPEYGGRARTNTQFVGDMYNTFLRRGGDLDGVKYWIGQLDTGARTRENVRQAFISSPEFSARVAAVIAQGCLQ